jgi:quinol monooxygenase YgiN
MIIHTVAFKLKHAAGSEEEVVFLDKARALSAIEGVDNFGVYRQISSKNPYDFNLSMEFADQAAYDIYNQHPVHQDFVHNVWLVEVDDFLEADFVRMSD